MLAVRTKSGRVEFEGPAQALTRRQADRVDRADAGADAGVEVGEIEIDLTEEGESDEGEGEGEGEGEEEMSDAGLETIEEEPELEEHFDEGDSDPGVAPGALLGGQSFTPHHAGSTALRTLGVRPGGGQGVGLWAGVTTVRPAPPSPPLLAAITPLSG